MPTDAPDATDLLAGFPLPTGDAWDDALRAELGEAPFERLLWPVEPGVVLRPFHRADDADPATPLQSALRALQPGAPPALVPWTEAFEQPGAHVIDETAFSDAGAGAVEALAATLALLADALDGGARPGAIRVGVGPSVVPEAARLRALRLLAARVAKAFGVAAPPIHAVTSRFWMTRAAAHTNLLRGTLGATAAFLGGADALTVRPHTLLAGAPSAHARRIADNVHHLLIHESHLGEGAPLGPGAYTLDVLTETLARAAWTRFGEIESAGGFARARDGIAAKIEAESAALFKRIEAGRVSIVGTNRYADAADRIGAASDNALAPNALGLARRRAAEPYEHLRAAVEAAGAPSVALLRFSEAMSSAARAGFARGVFAVAGVAAVETASADEARGAHLVVLCSSDAAYGDAGLALARTLTAAGGPLVYVAGPETEHADALREAGVTGFLHAKQPLLPTLRDLVGRLHAR